MQNKIDKKVIITGAPGAGKSTLLNHLKDKGYTCHQEISRMVIKESLDTKSGILPWNNVEAFSNKVLEKMLLQYSQKSKSGLIFCDRAIPDIIAYLLFGNKSIAPNFFKEINKANYHSTVFIAPPWEEIYVNDNERMESFETAQQLYNCLKKLYDSIGFKLIEIPKEAVNYRAEFLLNQLQIS